MSIVAHFKTQVSSVGKRIINVGCIVTIKDDGKISITKKWGGYYKPDYYKMEKEIKDLLVDVESGLKNEKFSNVVNNNLSEDGLIELVREQTKDLLALYIEKNKEWNRNEYLRLEKVTEKKVLEKDGKDFEWKGEVSKIHTTKSRNKWNQICKIVDGGIEKHIEKGEKDAILKYNYATERVCLKIKEKGLDLANIKVIADKINIVAGNLTMMFTDGKIVINCFTILAWGEINAPHYRYLIK